MRLSTRGRYAVMAMVALAARQAAGATAAPPRRRLFRCGGAEPPACPPACPPVSLAEIAASQDLSLPYLEQIFASLRRAGLVASARGPGGGYRLARDAAAISVAEVVEAVDEAMRATRCEGDTPGCLAGARCPTHDLWAELGEQIRIFLGGLTLADVVAQRVLGRASAPRAPAELPVADNPA